MVDIYVEDNKATVVTAGTQGPQGEPGYVTGITTEIEKLEFVGKGTGASKTTTIIVGEATLAESFGVGDELYLQWVLPEGIDRTVDPQITGSFFPILSAVGETVSWQIDFLADVHGTNLTDATTILYMVDIPLSENAYETVGGALTFPAGLIAPVDVEAVHIRIKRIASSSDPTRAAIEHIGVELTTDGKVGEQGPAGSGGVAAVNAQTGTTYTTVLSDAESLVTMDNAGANNITIPPNSDVAYAIGARILISMKGVGVTTVVEGAGVTINTPSTLVISGQHATVEVLKTATDVWLLRD